MRIQSTLLSIAGCLCALTEATKAVTATAGTVSFSNTIRFLFDTDGNQVDAYGSKVNNFNGTYYLYGNSFAIEGVAFGIKSYSSSDLVNWTYEGFLYDPYGDNPCSGSGGCGRPHIVYSPTLGKYVLWANAGSSGYVIATSSSPSGGFEFLSDKSAIDPRFNGLQPADFAVETFGNTGYIVFSALNFEYPNAGSIWPPIQQTIHISQLTNDFVNTTQVSYNVTSSAFDLIDQETESPDLFTRNGTYYVAASNTCAYCNGSIALLYRSQSIQGPWTRQIISGYSCNGQVEGVLPLTNPSTGEITYVWHSTSVPGGPRTGFGGHIFQPLIFNPDGSVQDLDCSSNDALGPVTFTLGNGTTPSNGSLTTATDGSPAIANYQAVCDSDQFVLYQTWTSSKAGVLKSVAVNIAASVQTTALTINVFKFSSYADLVSPNYKYALLSTISYTPTNLSYVFDTALLSNINANITKGDLLGLSIAGPDFAPYCHLEYDTAHYPHGLKGGDKLGPLYQQGQGQNSWRGLNGKNSIVYQRPGRGLKFFATVE